MRTFLEKRIIKRQRFANASRIVGIFIASLLPAFCVARADVFSNVPETAGYSLVYTLPIPNDSLGWNSVAVPYSVNNLAGIADNSFSRIGYYLELQTAPGQPLQYVYASMNAAGLTQSASKLGVPTTTSGAFFQQNLTSMNVFSNVPGIVTGTGLGTGNIEFWPSDYGQNNTAGVPNARSDVFDFGDGGANTSAGHGSMQIHNFDIDGAGPGTAGQTLFAYNAWGSARRSELGVGNQVGGSGNPDWTFNTTNIATFSLKNFQVVVGGSALPPPPPPPPPGPMYMPLGDSITEGQGAPGGYRTRLFQNLSVADPSRTPNMVGSATTNTSAPLVAAGETNHEGHGGYRINHIASNLAGNDATGGNNGGFWLTGTGGRPALFPDFVLLHIGTNDILQNFNTGTMAMRLDALVDQILTRRPDAHLLLSNIIPINTTASNALVLAYNNQIENVIVPKYLALGEDITFVDQYSNFVDGNGNIIGARLPDGIHPNQAGYDLMGDTWAAAIASVPEPSGVALVAFGALGLLARRSRGGR